MSESINAYHLTPTEIVESIIRAQATRIAELEQQLADANRAARYETDVASQAIADLEPYRKDAARYQWIRSRVPGGTYRIMGIVYSEGGEGVDAAIDSAIQGEKT